MSYMITSYVFDASAGTIALNDFSGVEKHRILGVWNATRGAKLYDPHVPNYGATLAADVLTLTDVDTSAMADTDDLLIFYWYADVYQAEQMQQLTAILNKLITGPSTEAKQDAIITLLTAIDGKDLSTAARQDEMIAALATLTGVDYATEATLNNVFTKVSTLATETSLNDLNTRIGRKDEAAAATDTADSGLNGLLKRLLQRITTFIGLFPSSIGQKTAAGSLAVVLASDQTLPLPSGAATAANQTSLNTAVGATNETAPASDTATSGLNGRLQRIAQRLTSLIALFPTSLGQKTKAASLAVTLASDTDTLTVANAKSSSANTPSILTSTGTVISSNASRKKWGVQNLGTNILYVRMGASASATVFHALLAGSIIQDDGTGGSYEDNTYTGDVSVFGTSPRYVVFEL